MGKRIRRFLACFFAVFALISCAALAEDAPDRSLSHEEMLDRLIHASPEDAQRALTVKPEVSAPHHKDFTYDSDTVLSGLFQSHVFYFYVENYWDAQYAYAEIQIDVSQLISDVPASLTFTVNDAPVVSYLIDYQNGRSQTFYVRLPMRLLRVGFNTFGITGYARILDDEGCLDDFTDANWVSIRKESYIQVGYALQEHGRRLSYFPYPFITSVDETGSGTWVVVPEAMSGKELEAALTLRAALSQKTGGEDLIHLARANDMPRNATGWIIIAEYGHLPSSYQAMVDACAAPDALTEKGLALFEEKDGTPLMLITSRNPDCLLETVAMLLDEERVTQETDFMAFVSKGGIAIKRANNADNMSASGRFTLEALVGRGVEFIGPYRQEAFIYLPYSGGFVLSEASKVVLNFRYSKNLDFDRSIITVYWGDVPVASKKLSAENADGDELSFTMPYDVVGTHADSIRVTFDLELPELFCTPRMDEMPWAYIAKDSVFYLPVGENTDYQFQLRPYPFERGSVYNDLVIVIPESMDGVQLQALGQLMTAYGVYLDPYGEITVVRDTEITDDLKRHHLIVWGTYQDNALVRELNDHLGFAFHEDGSAYQSNSKLVLSERYAYEMVTLQLLGSPYEAGKAVLVCSTVFRENFQTLSEFLEKEERLWALSGDTVLIDSEMTLKTYDMQEKPARQKAPVLKQLLEENRSSTVFSLIALSVMLLLLLVILLIFTRTYWNQKKKK